jgi:23S rRNA (uridine2552-2'-O)-methyltransferase
VPSEWLRRRKKDQFHRLAKKRGFRSRASFKLLQIAKKYQFIKLDDRVLDLGAAPGGWLQAAHQLAGEQGQILGVDREPIDSLPYANVSTLIGDITEASIADQLKSKAGSGFDVVLSDLAPDVSGVWEVDQARQIELARSALRISRLVLRPSGNMLVKVFQGPDLEDFRAEMKHSFRTLRIVKPPASRPESAELYFLGLDFLG